jgi:hypothetical protein
MLASPNAPLHQVVAQEALEVLHIHMDDLTLHGGPAVVRWARARCSASCKRLAFYLAWLD